MHPKFSLSRVKIAYFKGKSANVREFLCLKINNMITVHCNLRGKEYWDAVVPEYIRSNFVLINDSVDNGESRYIYNSLVSSKNNFKSSKILKDCTLIIDKYGE